MLSEFLTWLYLCTITLTFSDPLKLPYNDRSKETVLKQGFGVKKMFGKSEKPYYSLWKSTCY